MYFCTLNAAFSLKAAKSWKCNKFLAAMEIMYQLWQLTCE